MRARPPLDGWDAAGLLLAVLIGIGAGAALGRALGGLVQSR